MASPMNRQISAGADPVKGLADNELKDKLKRRHVMSEGEHNDHCFVVRPAQREGEPRPTPQVAVEQDGGVEPTPDEFEEAAEDEAEQEAEASSEESTAEEGAEDVTLASPQPGCDARIPKIEITPAAPPTGTSNASADAAAGAINMLESPHFDMYTPQVTPAGSRETSPRLAKHAAGGSTGVAEVSRERLGQTLVPESMPAPARSLRTAAKPEATHDSAPDKLEFEWQFEIINSLPRDRAIALVDYIRHSQQARAEACTLAKQLQRSNSELERRLQALPAGALEPRGHGQSRRCRSLRCCCWCWAALFVLPLLALAAAPLAAASGAAAPLLEGAPRAIGSWPELYESASSLGSQGLALGSQGLAALQASFGGGCAGGSVRETTVRELMLRETTTREYTREEFERLKSEHATMRGQLERLNMDIDDAVHRGQDMVCWKV